MAQAINDSPTLPQFPQSGSVTDKLFSRLLGRRIYRGVKSGYGWLKHEKNDRTSLPLGRRLQVWRHGFYAESALLYNLPQNDAREYLSDYTRGARYREINVHNDFFSHRLVLRSFLLAMGFRQAETLALVFEGRILSDPFGRTAEHMSPEELMRRLGDSGRSYIVKPENGACGGDVFLLERRGGRWVRRRGRDTTPFDPGALLRESRNDPEGRMMLIEERLEQGPFWQRLFPDSANTIRVLTLWSPGEPAPFIARAVQRIGRPDTVPTDDWSGGGISVLIDLASGTLGQGRLRGKQPTESSVTRHPDSGAEITGAVLPGWDRIQDTVLRAAASLPFNRTAGWDLLVTSDGEPVIIGANGDTEINLLQVHGGLLADPRVRRFYQEVGALGRNEQSRRPRS